MSYILENYVQPAQWLMILYFENELNNGNFDTMVISKINSYIGKVLMNCAIIQSHKDTRS